MKQSVHVVSLGARTPLGFGYVPTCAAVRAGIDQIEEHPSLLDGGAEPVRMAMDHWMDPMMFGGTRMSTLLRTALVEAYAAIESVLQEYRGTIPLWVGLPETRPGWTIEEQTAFQQQMNDGAVPACFAPIIWAPYGHGAGLSALQAAKEQLLAGATDLCVVAGVDSYLQPDTLKWLDEHRQLATDYHRGGFFPGEGAAAIVLASERGLYRLQLKSLARLTGTGVAKEAHIAKSGHPCLGEGLTAAILQAMAEQDVPDCPIERIICDINGERYRAEEWGFAALRLSKACIDPAAYLMPADCWGDMGAASGPLLVVLAVEMGWKTREKGKRFLIWSSSESGVRSAIVLELSRD